MDCRKWSDKYSTDCKLKYNSIITQNNYTSCVRNFLNNFSKYREPKEINSLFTSSPRVSDLPMGVYKTKYGFKAINFQSTTKSNTSETFKTVKEAETFYKKSKTLKLQTVLKKYKNLDNDVYKILKEYKF